MTLRTALPAATQHGNGRLAHILGCQLRCPAGWAGRYLAWAMRIANRRANALAMDTLAPRDGESILEIGFGPGDTIAKLLRRTRTGTIFGIDHSTDMLAMASHKNANAIRKGRLHLHHGRSDALPIADDTIDSVLAVNVAYFWSVRDVEEACRTLVPGGKLVVYVTERDSMRHWSFAHTGSHRLFNAEDLRQLLAEGGFDAASIDIAVVDAGMGVQGLIGTARK